MVKDQSIWQIQKYGGDILDINRLIRYRKILEVFSLKGKNAIVTGGNKGLGRAISLGLASAGANVVIAARELEASENVAKEIKKIGTDSLAVKTDVSNQKDVKDLVNKTIEKFNRIDILVNNAGVINRPRQAATEIPEEVWDWVIDINLKGTFLVSREVAKSMIENKKGKILCIGSILCEIAQAWHAPYVASKGGIRQLVKALALEWAPYKIHVNALCPHYFRTDFVKKSLEDPERYEQILKNTPMGRVGEPEDLIGSSIFLCSEASNLMTGQIILIDAGYSLQ